MRVILDADLEYDPNDPSDLPVPVREWVADATFGTRARWVHDRGRDHWPAASRARIYEVPITYVARRREEGKKIQPIEGIRGLMTLLKMRFS